MPPAVSDDESDIDLPDDIPARPAKIDTEIEIADEDEDDLDEDEYQVETILEHKKRKGRLVYKVKWLGYEDEDDQTWEPIENLENAKVALDVYHAKIGGTPEPVSTGGKGKGKGGGKKRTASEALEAPTSGKKPRNRKSDANGDKPDLKLPVGSWENEVARVAAIIEEKEEVPFSKGVTDIQSLLGLLEWNDGRNKTRHKMSLLRIKCPQKLLDYYEMNLVFKGDPRYLDEQE